MFFLLITMSEKISIEDAKLLITIISEAFFEETHFMEEMLGEKEKLKTLQHLVTFLQNEYPDLINEESVFYRTIFED